ncbi:type IV toxin-antitoxin system AbiEi family antitoxin domain-containing protein [Halorubrum sp. Atlit-26R]|uniref:helix-turn-helix transcriptional regulator n=1 Tax=Halorubrum sp. Atlit-26R TaxID=2282128 RepID=UPI000EF22D3D|nr:type IV toxin-antitoxin system AbiEi family antitoxin domain-containing protein [Halorubrum sp. Atlit-26R]RLM67615.1 MarR family transcriptional regulator [Halorubrum sp. Atlit-26R]
MATSATGVLTPADLNDTDDAVLDVLRSGRVTPQYAADEMGVSRTYASERLKRLVEHNHVEKVAPGLYELIDDPRDDAGEDDVEELKRHVRAAGEAIEEQDVDALRRHVRAACKVIADE